MLCVLVAVATVGCVVQAPPGYAPGGQSTGPYHLGQQGSIHANESPEARKARLQMEQRELDASAAQVEAAKKAEQKAIENERLREAERVRQAREKEASAKAREEALAAEALAIKARIDNPPPFKLMSVSQLSGPAAKVVARLTGQRIRATGAIGVATPETTGQPAGWTTVVVSLTKKRLVGCSYGGVGAKVAAAKVDDDDTGSITGTVDRVVPQSDGREVIFLQDCDPPIRIKKAPLARFEASAMTRGYESNHDAASSKYDNTIMEVAGTVLAVTGGRVHLSGHSARYRFVCELAEGTSDDQVARLGRGRRAVLRATVGGFFQGDWRTRFVHTVLASGCEIIR